LYWIFTLLTNKDFCVVCIIYVLSWINIARATGPVELECAPGHAELVFEI
jgi:hypothetical protein